MKLSALLVITTLRWINTLARSYVIVSLRSWQLVLKTKRPVQRVLEWTLQRSAYCSNVTVCFLLCFSANPSEKVVRAFSSTACLWPFLLLSSLHRGKQATALISVCLLLFGFGLLNPASRVPVSATSCLLPDPQIPRGQSLFQPVQLSLLPSVPGPSSRRQILLPYLKARRKWWRNTLL